MANRTGIYQISKYEAEQAKLTQTNKGMLFRFAPLFAGYVAHLK